MIMPWLLSASQQVSFRSLIEGCKPDVHNTEFCFESKHGLSPLDCLSIGGVSAPWDEALSKWRCCAREVDAPVCDASDEQFLQEVSLHHQTGTKDSELFPEPPNPEILHDRLQNGEVDREVERCPASTLVRLALDVEQYSAASDASKQFADVLTFHLQVLHAMAMTRRLLPVSKFTYPNSIVHIAVWRALTSRYLHFTVTQNTLSVKVDAALKCTDEPLLISKCAIKRGQPAKMFSDMLLSDLHAHAVMNKFPALGTILVAFSKLVLIAEMTGIRDEIVPEIASDAITVITFFDLTFDAKTDSRKLEQTWHSLAIARAQGTAIEYAEFGKESLLKRIVESVGFTNKFFVEIGVQDGRECNTRHLRHNGWQGIMLDQTYENVGIGLHRRLVTAENIVRTLADLKVPQEFDLLSIDIDGNDFWIWQAIAKEYRPRLVLIEFQKHWTGDAVSRYVPRGLAHETPSLSMDLFSGASFDAMMALATSLGYNFVTTTEPEDIVFARMDVKFDFELGTIPAISHDARANRLNEYILANMGDLYATSAEAIRASKALPLNPAWHGNCLSEALVISCKTAGLCAKSF